MRNILFDQPREELLQKLRRIIARELTPCQRDAILAYYFEDQTMAQIARARGVNKTTVWRTLKRAEETIRRVMQY